MKRRTQQERREGTIRALLDAATETLIDDGYAATSVASVCERAELSQGALFRHFPTREALMVAVGEDVGAQQLAAFRKKFVALQKGRTVELVAALHLVREACRSRTNQAWYELALAARTSKVLRDSLAPVAQRYHADIHRIARELLPELAMSLGATFTTLVGLVLAALDGEAIQRILVREPVLEDARLELFASMARHAQ